MEPDANTKPVTGIVALIERYKELVAPIANQVVGHVAPTETPSQQVSKANDASGESPLGNLIADAQKEDPSVVPEGGGEPVIAFMNPGGIRADLLENGDGNITYEAAFNKILQVSGIEYTWDKSNPPAEKVLDATIQVNGVPLVDTQTYRVVVNSFLSDGGDGFTVLRAGTDKYVGGLDIDALTRYLGLNDPYTPTATDRIDVQD